MAIEREDARAGWYHSGHLIALDIARALSFLHSHNVLHGVHPRPCLSWTALGFPQRPARCTYAPLSFLHSHSGRLIALDIPSCTVCICALPFLHSHNVLHGVHRSPELQRYVSQADFFSNRHSNEKHFVAVLLITKFAGWLGSMPHSPAPLHTSIVRNLVPSSIHHNEVWPSPRQPLRPETSDHDTGCVLSLPSLPSVTISRAPSYAPDYEAGRGRAPFPNCPAPLHTSMVRCSPLLHSPRYSVVLAEYSRR